MPVKMFFCYAHEDEELLNRLKTQLIPLEKTDLINVWYDRDINAGAEWEREIIEHLNTAHIILLLISPDFMASDYCYSVEMQRAMERHERREARVVPIILRHVNWKDASFGKLQALPTDAKPVKGWNDLDEAFLNIEDGIRKVVKQLRDEQQHNQALFPKDAQPSMTREVILTHQTGKYFLPLTDKSQVTYVLIEVEPQVRMPFNFVWVLDHSRTMKGAKLKNVKEALKSVIDRLEPNDYISVVIFAVTAQVIIPSIPARDPVGMKATIDRIREADVVGRTISLGMIQGLNELRRWNIPNAIHRMILLTDGVTYGDSERCRQLARYGRTAGISIYPLGIGQDWDENLLDTIGEMSGGIPAEFIRNPSDAITVIEEQLQSAVAVAVLNATLTLRLPQGVTPNKVVKVLPIISDLGQFVLSERQVVIHLGDLEKHNPQSILVELMIDPRREGLCRIAQSELSYDVPIANLMGERIRDDIVVTFTNNVNQISMVNEMVMYYARQVKNN